nr:hypothetical protein [Tanacetum cinerariifolium]
MDLKDREYFNQLLQLTTLTESHAFGAQKPRNGSGHSTTKQHLTLANTLALNQLLMIHSHYINFIAYNEVQSKADVSCATLTDYIGCIHRISDPIVTGDATRNRVKRRIINI